MKRILAASLLVLCTAGGLLAEPGRIRRAVERVPGRYIVMLRNVLPRDVAAKAADLAQRHGGRLGLIYADAFTGFSAELTEQQATLLSNHPLVFQVEEVAIAHLSTAQTLPAGLPAGLLWHLDRTDQRGWIYQGAGDNLYTYCERGRDVTVYVIDTGINRSHTELLRPDLTSRVINGVKFASDHYVWPGESDDYGTLPCGGWTEYSDLNDPNNPDPLRGYNGGHGTAVASLIGGNTLGVAKDVTLVPIRVFPCATGGNTEWIAWGVDWIRGPANPNRARRPAVVNMSFRIFDTEPLASAFEHAINGLVLDSPGWTGIPVVSANNQGSANSRTSPARMAYRNTAFGSPGRVISVGGMAENDARWQCDPAVEPCAMEFTVNGVQVPAGSNFGDTVDIWAPAHNIEAAHIRVQGSVRGVYQYRSGTSFSAPLVTGVIARLLQVEPGLTPTQVWSRIQQDSTQNPGWWIDPANLSNNIIFRAGAVSCNPEYP